jgi:hypothetical protein
MRVANTTMKMLTSELRGRPLWEVGAVLVLIAVILASASNDAQSLTYSRGQVVHPAFEGWEKNPDGSFSLLFGYMNDNWEEEIDVAAGPENTLNLFGADQGQPTRFLPRRNRFVFKVRVPADFGEKELVWTLTTHGVTEKAYASLKSDYFIDNLVVASETGALGLGRSDPKTRANQPPTVAVQGEKDRTARVGRPIELIAVVTDDGVPRAPGQGGVPAPNPALLARRALVPPVRLTVRKALGLHLSWFVYRGAGQVTFDPIQTKVWEDTRAGANSPWSPLWVAPSLPPDGRWVVHATFDTPGTYVLRARADDGALLDDDDLTVTVTR